MSSCTARYHDTATAYTKHRCRCDTARHAHTVYQAALQVGCAEPGRVPAVATTRRLRGLYLAGHDAIEIAAVSGLAERTLLRLVAGTAGPTVLASTAATVTDVTARLARVPGRRPHARRRGLRERWAPLPAWDGQVFAIDDPTVDDRVVADLAHLPVPLRPVVLAEHEAAAEAHEARQTAARMSLAGNRARRWRGEPARHTPPRHATVDGYSHPEGATQS